MREAGRRLRAAWRVLRDGEPTAPTPPPTVEVPLPELRDLVERALAVVGLPYAWANGATADEMKTASNALDFALLARRTEWAHVESGRWPVLMTTSARRADAQGEPEAGDGP